MLTLKAVDSYLYSFVPFALMFVANFAIAFKFMIAKCNQNNSSESTNKALAKSATRGTAMVVTVSVTFLILTAPTAVYSAVYRWYSLGDLPLYRIFMNLAQYLNHSINGLLYCIVGSKFRGEIVKILCHKKARQFLHYAFSQQYAIQHITCSKHEYSFSQSRRNSQ